TFVTDVAELAVVREVRERYLDAGRLPASTLVEVNALARPEFLPWRCSARGSRRWYTKRTRVQPRPWGCSSG
ncbi:MAG: RidA family protein, partial [Gemmatimonadales bacterium]